MSAPTRLAGFAAALAVLTAGGAALGGAIDPDRSSSEPASGGHGGAAMSEEHDVRGVAVAENGLRLVVDDPELGRGRARRLTFRVVGEDGATVSDFDVAHTKRMHLIVVRRDMTGFQHLHPEQAADGTWSTPLTLPDAGSYRVFADFERDGEKTTLASDLRVDGPADLAPLPAPASTATSDGGYDVALETEPGEDETHLDFTVTKGGEPVQTEPYLGAGGHLVALREGDMAFLHVHPTDEHGTSFGAEFPTPGRYRLFLQFQVAGEVQTVAFTQEIS
jgi:hypothetical protein